VPDFDGEWVDDDAGRLVPLYALTGGRTRPTYSRLNLATLVRAAGSGLDGGAFEPEQVEILQLCRSWLSVAEISSHLKVPLAVVKIQLSDLIDRGAVVLSSGTTNTAEPVSRDQLQQVLDGLHAM
jgi:hypothetical protein